MVPESVSYWQRTSSRFSLPTDLPPVADVAIVGGGLLGAATCYWLARAGVHVVLLERTALADGATGRNGGFVRAGTAGSYPEAIARLGQQTARAVMDITYENRVLLRQVLQEEEIACDYREPGALQLALTEAQSEEQRQEVDLLRAEGFSAEWLERAQVQAMINTPLAPEILSGRFLPEQGLLHSARLVQGLVQAALRHSAKAYQAEVHKIEQDGAHIRLRTSQGSLVAQRVIVAINAWTSTLLPELANVIVPVLEQMQAYETLDPIFSMALTVHMNTGEYMQQTPSGNILIGGCGSVAPNAGVGIWESMPTIPVQKAIEQVLPRIFPLLAPQLRVVQRWAGILGCTQDMHPIVDVAPTFPQVFFVGGFTGHGMPFGLRFGQLLATAAMGGFLPSALQPFRLDRPSLGR
ncbi:FAD-dependent oxidoreductase [Ktedonobacter sp. SOSP1-52]|uniref:NAD(P)/FAD-dependent oxidoreductase n=1 Tax=Ktedonobacter sp. SOSP1-52 TaxID=2778366 RepID=UPI0019162262|nr:FAD-binding oxidoreductase [Ktedonobacter sp. SOSP1-52]GHO70788.1 FAD-dependent oxidoreductase [Ktedonobacter sp. SOSP1-52]